MDRAVLKYKHYTTYLPNSLKEGNYYNIATSE